MSKKHKYNQEPCRFSRD